MVVFQPWDTGIVWQVRISPLSRVQNVSRSLERRNRYHGRIEDVPPGGCRRVLPKAEGTSTGTEGAEGASQEVSRSHEGVGCDGDSKATTGWQHEDGEETSTSTEEEASTSAEGTSSSCEDEGTTGRKWSQVNEYWQVNVK